MRESSRWGLLPSCTHSTAKHARTGVTNVRTATAGANFPILAPARSRSAQVSGYTGVIRAIRSLHADRSKTILDSPNSHEQPTVSTVREPPPSGSACIRARGTVRQSSAHEIRP